MNLKIHALQRTLGYSLITIGMANAQIRDGFNQSFLAANDDDSTDLVSFGFEIDLFGENFNAAYLNNNGNITFNAPLSTFTPSVLDLENTAIIAPFFADVDTRGPESQVMTYGTGSVSNLAAFGVNWFDVGYYSSNSDKLNSFQLVLIDRSDIGEGYFDIEFNYGQIEWETGDASGGENGLGGDSARVGYSNGTGDDFVELDGSAVNGAFLDDGPNSLVNQANDTSQPGRQIYAVRDVSFSPPHTLL